MPILKKARMAQKTKYRAKSKVLQQNCRRLKSRVQSLEQLLIAARNKNMISFDNVNFMSSVCIVLMKPKHNF